MTELMPLSTIDNQFKYFSLYKFSLYKAADKVETLQFNHTSDITFKSPLMIPVEPETKLGYPNASWQSRYCKVLNQEKVASLLRSHKNSPLNL